MTTTDIPELLSPAGSPRALQAAIDGGANAVYFGSTRFNARMNAENFGHNEISRAIEKCHESGVLAYITFNTLTLDRELDDALSEAAFLYGAGADALIVADLGLASLIKRYIPDLSLHASTQASGHSVSCAKRLSSIGFSRMVCAREMRGEDIARLCASSPIEIEMFVHGAMCVSHSGQCLMSSVIGARSGNRGECAQPCRLPYNNTHPLSLKDMCLAAHMKEIIASGVRSLKIEGRMKSPAYVYGVTSLYRRLLDEGRNTTEKEIEYLADLFSRGGFTDGYYTGKIDSSMNGIRSEEDKKVSVTTAKSQKTAKTVIRPAIITERKVAPALPESVFRELKKEKDVFFRSAAARFALPSQIPDDGYFDIRYLPLDCHTKDANGVILPSVIFDREEKNVRNLLEKAVNNGASHVLCGNIGHIDIIKGLPVTVHGDFRLNVYGNASAVALKQNGFDDILLSPELTLSQIRDIHCKKSVIVYGRLPLMLLEKPVGQRALRDRRFASFPVIGEGNREVVYNCIPVYMADREKEMKAAGIFSRHFIFTDEDKKAVNRIIVAYKNKLPPAQAVRRIK